MNFEFPRLPEYIAMTLFALWGGIAQFWRRLKKGEVKFRIVELVGELIISGFAGLCAGALLLEAGVSTVYAIVLSGIGGHMGTRLIYTLEAMLSAALNRGLPPSTRAGADEDSRADVPPGERP